ncbi:hypothetical protein PI125_g6359 [Phytophthora idaei]|nr:hypothetical protein PI125_g6359 [Phytophthora idaei]
MAGAINGFVWLLFLLHVPSFVQVADAACANSCSGHGRCGSSNQCTCDSDWALAPDCSMRKCPTGVAWTDKAKTANVAHAMVECSNRGVCDYSKGECTCFNGYTGAACQRLRCPSDCSGHGLCYSSATLALQYGPDSLPSVAGDGVGPVYSNWEKDSMSSCMCDMGYTGPDCSQLMCAKNDDPLTTGQGYRTIQIQVDADASTNIALAGSVRVHFLGDIAVFSAVAVADAAHEQACAQAFQSMRTVLTATCTITSVNPVTAAAIYTVAFKEWVHLGGENNLLYHDGNPPLSSFTCDLTKVTSLNSPTCAVTDITATNVIEHVYCSNRGLCDFTTGECMCYADFKGLDCNQPSNVPDSIDDNDGFIINPMGLTYTGTVLHLKTAKGSQADFYFMKIGSSTLPILTMNGMGDTKLLNGNFELSTGSLTITTIAQTSTAADIANTHTTFTGTALKVRTTRASNNAFKLLEAMTGGTTTVVEIRGDGLTTIYTGGLYVVTGGGRISHTLDGPSLTVTNSYGSFTNSLLKLSTSRASLFPGASDFVLIEATANSFPAFTVEASGRTTIANGGLIVTGLGGAQISNSDPADPALVVSATGTSFTGDAVAIKTFSGSAHNMLKVTTKVGSNAAIDLFTISNSGLTTITQGGLHIVSGGATIDTGGLHVGYGGETIDFGGLRVKNGGGTIELGGLNVINGGGNIASTSAVADILTVEATSTLFSNNARVLYINSKSTVAPSTSMHYLIEATVGASSTSVFKVGSTGLTTIAGQGSGAAIISDTGTTANTLTLTNSATSFNKAMLAMTSSDTDATTVFSFIDAKLSSPATSVFTVDGSGLTTIAGQGSGGASISDNAAVINTLMVSNRISTGFTATLLSMNAVSTSKLYTLIDAQSSGSSRFKVAASGLTTIVGSGSGGAIISDSNSATTSTLAIQNTDISRSFSGTLLRLDTTTLQATDSFSLIDAKVLTISKFTVAASGLTTISAGGLSVTGGITAVDTGVTVTTGGARIYDTGTAADTLTVMNKAATGPFTKALLTVDTTVVATGFSLIDAKAAGVSQFTITAGGRTTIVSGGFTVTAGGAIITAGGLSVPSDGASIGGGLTVGGGVTVSNTGLTVSGGGASITGGITAVDTGVTVTTGGARIYDTGTAADTLTAKNSATGTFSGALLSLDTGTLTSGFSLISAGVAGGSPKFSVAASGLTTIAAGGLSVTGGVTITNTGLTVITGGASITDTGTATSTLTLTNSAGTFDKALLSMDSTATSGFSLINAMVGGTPQFTVAAGGATTIASGGLSIKGGVTVVDTGVTVSAGDVLISSNTQSAATNSGALVVTGGVGIGRDLRCAGTIYGTAVTTPSDRRLKTTIQDLSSSQEIIRQLHPVTYEWRRDQFPSRNFPAGVFHGFLADEVEQILPDLVEEDADGWKSLNYIGIVPHLVRAVQEMQGQLEASQVQMTRMQHQIDVLPAARA